MNAKELRIVFMGTPEFAVPSLRALVEGGYNVVAVVTMPDKPAGRGQQLRESDVKRAAVELGLPVLQPEKLRDENFVAALRDLKPDLGIVIAFRMLPEVVWAMPRLGTFNLHASLLPEYRGAAPINWAIINGDTETGVTTFLLNHEIDKGAIVGQLREPIAPEDNIGTLYDRLMHLGTGLVLDTVEKLAAGEVNPIEQQHIDESTLRPAPKIFKEDCLIDWSKKGCEVINLVRGLSPYPAAWCNLVREDKAPLTAKIFRASFTESNHSEPTGTIRSDYRNTIEVAVADGWVCIEELQLAGKRRMSAHDLLLGFREIDSYRMK
ncbi:MAG: methionyl-tRNA formyltransferase [Alistipes sp.]|nr:methionyl-tRNA formyltransferase [Alistipes sp.]